jgi:hypothetical protein
LINAAINFTINIGKTTIREAIDPWFNPSCYWVETKLVWGRERERALKRKYLK